MLCKNTHCFRIREAKLKLLGETSDGMCKFETTGKSEKDEPALSTDGENVKFITIKKMQTMTYDKSN